MINHSPICLGLDIDDSTTSYPELFAVLSQAVIGAGGRVIIITARIDTPESRRSTAYQLDSYGVAYSKLTMFPPDGRLICKSPAALTSYERMMYQKVWTCKREKVTALFDDDPTVIQLMSTFLPDVVLFHCLGSRRIIDFTTITRNIEAESIK